MVFRSTHPHSAGNGSIMRLAPVPLFFAGKPKEAIEKSALSSRTTHGGSIPSYGSMSDAQKCCTETWEMWTSSRFTNDRAKYPS
nr:ADP-ribosylglycohydrolase family protein [Desulforhabdus amnigena]